MVFGGFVLGAGWIDGCMTCNFTPVLKVFQSYFNRCECNNDRLCAIQSPLCSENFRLYWDSNPRPPDQHVSALTTELQGQCVLVLKHQLRWIEFH